VHERAGNRIARRVQPREICPGRDIGGRALMTGVGLRGPAEEQTALRRIATVVARGAPPEKVSGPPASCRLAPG
jgi:hypothetical protein